jgi:hypothetical protein
MARYNNLLDFAWNNHISTINIRLHSNQEVSIMKVYAFIHPDLKTLCCALLSESVPSNVEYVELEVETPDDVILDNGQIRLKTEAEKLEEEKRKKTYRIEKLCSDAD